jgi:membrane protease YdiL (CAAX protease family)
MKDFLDPPSSEEGRQSGPFPAEDFTGDFIEQRSLPETMHPTHDDLPTWTFRDMSIGVALTLAPWLTLAAFSLLASSSQSTISQPLSPTSDLISGVITLIVQVLLEGTFLIAPLWYAVYKPRRQATLAGLPDPGLRPGFRALGFRSFNFWRALTALALGLLAILAASILYSTIATALHVSLQTNVDILVKRAAAQPWTTLATLIGAVLVAPFCEEIFFRGFFFQGLRLRINVWAAIVLSAIIFGLAHGDSGSLALLIVIGLLLAVLRWQTRSIWPGMALHMLNNALGAYIIFQAIQFH